MELPLVREAFAAGELSYSKVRAVTRVATPQHGGAARVLDRHATGAQLEKLVRSYRGGALVSAGDPLDYSIAVEGLIMRELPDP